MKNLILLGSTGSIGENTLDIVSRFPDRFRISALAAGKNILLLEKQIRKFNPSIVSVSDSKTADALRARCSGLKTEIVAGTEGLLKAAAFPEGEMVVSAIVGAAGLMPTLAAIRAKKNIALANKETMVMAGELVCQEAVKAGVRIFPIDSEHSAIFQALSGNQKKDVRKIILTASGGPFLHTPREQKEKVTPEAAVRHPNLSMGRKISIDSATMMNKGLDVIEARWLFDFPGERIEVLIHPQSIVHSMVEYVDGSVMAQMGIPDMRGPISYAIHYPERLPLDIPPLNLVSSGMLSFSPPDDEAFPCLSYGFEALKAGGTLPAVLNAANEEAVAAFLDHKIGFLKIEEVIKKTMDSHQIRTIQTIEDVNYADQWARKEAGALIEKLQGKS
ncbi:MAG: 1-deoxy-D-xylulose-5-phosphate reductoisomerase [Nitrospirae bacterium]|nr:1-deoxy-D-xylulose-5-phosphate reductoisomerase [Nitrospirota bacterium]